MNFGKKLLSAVLAIGFFSGVSSTKALEDIYEQELDAFEKIMFPADKNEITVVHLPSFYRYLQRLFFLIVSDDKNDSKLGDIYILRNFIEKILTRIKKNDNDIRIIREKGYMVFAELIGLILNCSNVIICQIANNQEYTIKNLKPVLYVYQVIDKDISLTEKLNQFKLYDIYCHMKWYIFSECVCHGNLTPGTVIDKGILIAPQWLALSSFESYKNCATRIAMYYASIINPDFYQIERQYDSYFSNLPWFGQSCPLCGRTDIVVFKYPQPVVDVNSDVDGSGFRALFPSEDSDEGDGNMPLFPVYE